MSNTTNLTRAAHLRRPGHPGRRGRPAKSHDNRTVRAWMRSYWDRLDFCGTNPKAEDVLAGAALAREAGDTGRGLSVNRLFHVLRSLDDITTAGVADVLACAERTAQVYALAARVASRGLEPLAVDGLPGTGPVEDEDTASYMVPDMPACDLDF